jgi:hypothetical protein
MSSDQKVTSLTTTGAVIATGVPARLTSVALTGATAASSVTFKTGGTGGTVLLTLYTSINAGTQQVNIPGDGLRFDDGIYATVADANINSIVAFYTA